MAGRDHSQDQVRADARRKRQPAPEPKYEGGAPIFDAPVRSNTKDDLCLSVQKALGSYDKFRVLPPNELSYLHGIQYQPQTPLPREGGKHITQFPVVNGQVRAPPGGQQHPAGRSSSQQKGVDSSAAMTTSSHRHAPQKQAPAGASSSKGVKRESGTPSQMPSSGTSSSSQPSSANTTTTSSSSSSSSHNKAHRPPSHDKSKDSSQRRSKDGSSGGRTLTKPQPSGASDSTNSQHKTSSTSQSSKSDRPPSLSSAPASKSGNPRTSTNSANRGGSTSSSNSNASDSRTVLHANGLLTETEYSSITNYPAKSSNNSSSSSGSSSKAEQKDAKQAASHNSKKDSSASRDLDMPCVSPMPEIVTDFQSHYTPKPPREGKKERDAETKQRPRLDIPKKGLLPDHSKHKEVEKIFQKMIPLKTPVSAIQTPIKSEAPKFQFSDAAQSAKTSTAPASNPRKKLVDAIDGDAEKKRQGGAAKSPSLQNDLRLSDESDSEETQETNNANLNSSNDACEEQTTSSNSQRPSPPMKRASDSESSASDLESEEEENSSESESESDSDHDSPQPPSPPKAPKKSYSLLTHINKLQNEIPQMPQSTPFRGPPSVENPPSNSRVDTGEGSKLQEQSAESGDNDNDENDSFSNRDSFTDFHQLSESSNVSKASPSVVKSKSGSKTGQKPAVSKPAVKRPQPRTNNSSSSSKSGSAKGAASAPRVKPETTLKENVKAKPSKQVKNASTSQNKKSPGPGSGKGSTKPQEKKPTQRAKPREKKKPPISSPYVETDDSDSEQERTPSRPQKAAVNTSTSSTSSSASSSSCNTEATDLAVRTKVKPDSGKRMPGTKKGDNKYMVKPAPVEAFEHHRPHIDEFVLMDPILSPIRGDFHDARLSASEPHLPEVRYNKDGKPTILVRLKRELIDHLPKPDTFGRCEPKYETNVPGPSTQRRKDSTDPPEKPSIAIVKPVKRKTEEKSRPENKRPRLEKSPRRIREEALRGMRDEPSEPLDSFVSGESSLDRRQASERRSSVSSLSSQQTSHGGRSRKSDRDPHHSSSGSSRSKRDSSAGGRDPGAPPRLHHDSWASPERRHAERQFTADDYLAKGKRLKHQADTQVDKHAKALMYFEAVLYLTSCGNAIELDPNVPDEKAVTMYSDTCEIIRFILKLKGIHTSQEGNSDDNKLAVLCYRCQALLNMHMFKLKRHAARKLSAALVDHLKGTSSKPQSPSPWNASSRYTGTPSPVSPTPSPAGSVGSACSVGSQGSGASSDLVTPPSQSSSSAPTQPPRLPPPTGSGGSKGCNGLGGGGGGGGGGGSMVAVPQRILSTYLTYSNYSINSITFWEQADTLTRENLDFFLELDRECGELTLHSSTQELVRYIKRGLSKLRPL